MSSNINPNNIDGTYPVAGQDNNSQGFRDNFTNIKTNFQYAESEIDDLQSKVLLKAALSGSVLDNDMLGSLIYNGTIADFGAVRLALGPVSGSQTINYAAGHFQTLTTTGNVSLTFSNFPAAGTAAVVNVQITVGDTLGVIHTVQLPSAVSVNTAGITGINTSTNVITFPYTGVYSFQFVTSDGGSTITVNEVNKALSPFNNSSEDLAATGAANLATTTSYFSTAAAETATLAAGVAGQIKTFAMYADSGDMVITVTNAGWKSTGTGTITFDTIGDACTLQYINGKWFCIGNNGAVFA
jgi:hypothetical protein